MLASAGSARQSRSIAVSWSFPKALVLVGAGDAVFVGKLGDEWGICPGGPVAVDCGSGRLGDGGAVGGGHGWSLVAKNQVQPLSIRV